MLMTIRLELARDEDFPHGSSQRGYEFVAPLDLRHTRSGAWTFHYDIEGDPDDDEPGFRFESHAFNEGEYVSIREHDGRMRTFKVMVVRPCAPLRVS